MEKVLDSIKVALILNHERFSADAYQESGIIQETVLKFFDIPTLELRRDFGVSFTSVESNDNRFMALTGLTNEEQTFFSIKELDSSLRTYNRRSRLLLTFGIDYDSVKISRRVYTFFMLMADVGGLSSFLFSVAIYLLNIANY